MLIPAFHEVFGLCLVPETKVLLHPDDWSTYDPADHKADHVVEYLTAAGPRERERVLDLERAAARPRKTVLALDTRDHAEAEAAAVATADAVAAAAVVAAHPSPPVAVGAGDTPATPATED